MVQGPHSLEGLVQTVYVLGMDLLVYDLNGHLELLVGLKLRVVYLSHDACTKDSVDSLVKRVVRFGTNILVLDFESFEPLVVFGDLLDGKSALPDLLEEVDDTLVLDPVTFTLLRQCLPSCHEDGVILLQVLDGSQVVRVILSKLLNDILMEGLFLLDRVYLKDLLVDLFLPFEDPQPLELVIALKSFLKGLIEELNAVEET